jgi:hypothetical protein
MSLTAAAKPHNAGWFARVSVEPTGKGTVSPVPGLVATELAKNLHPFREVEIAWYPNHRLKITLKGGAPAVIRQAYLSGKDDVIVELAPRED